MKSEWAADTQENSSYAMGFAGLGEAVCLFCLIFIGIYDDGIKKQVRGVTLRTYDVTPIQRPTISPQRNAPALVAAEKKRPEIMQELRERQQAQQNQERAQESVETSPAQQQPGTDVAAISSAIKSQQASLRAYRHKAANGIGKPETNAAGIARATAEIERLQALLPG
jgi:hypothetical protein